VDSGGVVQQHTHLVEISGARRVRCLPLSNMQASPLSSSSIYPNAQPFFGIVETTVQALRLVYAARLGIIPRVLRRLNSTERNEMIVSGAVFVFSVEESGIRRWTDGRLFSPSRIDGNFLVNLGT